jgi:alpha-L-arabinofuranosidase
MLAREGHTQWNPDLIYFNSSEVKPTVNYFVQQLYGQNSGDTYLRSEVKLSDKNESVGKRVAVSVVRDSKSNDLIVKLVNMLPVAVNTQVKLKGMSNINSSATQSVLTGKPGDRKAEPVTGPVSVSDNFPCTLQAYSFTLIRIKTN